MKNKSRHNLFPESYGEYGVIIGGHKVVDRDPNVTIDRNISEFYQSISQKVQEYTTVVYDPNNKLTVGVEFVEKMYK